MANLRVAQAINLSGKKQVEFTFDILNVGNLLNSNWGVRELPSTTQPVGVSIQEDGSPIYSFDPTLTSTFTNDFSLLSRWQGQVGLRFRF